MFIGANWKLHGDTATLTQLTQAILNGLPTSNAPQVVLFPSFVYLPLIAKQIAGTPLCLGAQNQCEQAVGAFTGEVAASMLVDVGCRYVLLGHSERRHGYHETDAMIGQKMRLAFAAGLTPLLCVGETLAARTRGDAKSVVLQQLTAACADISHTALQKLVIAYEPVWAIGTGKAATPEEAQIMHAVIRDFLRDRLADQAAAVQIIYGGSVKPENAAEVFSMPDVDGGLIGGAALNAVDFLAICAT